MENDMIFLVTESSDGGYEAKAIGYSIYTQCDKLSELSEVLRDAVVCHFDDIPHYHQRNLMIKDEV